jgi:glutamyl-tRNA reductase
MAGLAVQAFRKREVARFTAVSRTLESAQALASSWAATADVLTNLPSLVQQADIILTSTTAGSYLLTEEMLRAATAARDGAPLVILDIAVPRNVDPASRQLPHVYLYDIDDLEGQAAAMQGQRQQELHKAQRLVNAEVDNYHHYLQQQRLVPLIKQVRGEAESIRKAEFERALQKMPGVDPEDLKQIDWLTRSIVKKLLHHPTLHLREQATAANGRTELYAEWIKELFGLSHE